MYLNLFITVYLKYFINNSPLSFRECVNLGKMFILQKL